MTSHRSPSPAAAPSIVSVVDERFALSAEAIGSFFAEYDERVARTCLDMARRFKKGGRLLAYGEGPQRSDAEHVAVEFVHPVIVGKRALPALALGQDDATASGAVGELRTVGRPEDILMIVDAVGIGDADGTTAPGKLLDAGRDLGLLTVVVTAGRSLRGADLGFSLQGMDALVAQEVAETLYHVIWELVHVFLDRGDLDALGNDQAEATLAGVDP
mgnify:CR=1 FL=1